MAAYCFQVLVCNLRMLDVPPAPPSIANDDAAVFVCLKKVRNGELRGCIGTFSPAPLHDQLRRYSQEAAFRDSRFSPIKSERELTELKCTVSVLHSFEPAASWKDWTIGVHGIQISFLQQYRGTFLPSVAKEQGWDHKETLEYLVKKAGYKGRVDETLLSGIEVKRYQESTACATFDDAKKMFDF